jgi:thymidylate synthase (FAD)
MGSVTVQAETTVNPLTLMGYEAGVCWGAKALGDPAKDFARGVDCLQSGHMRTAEFPQVYLILDGYSARVIRELYTHIGGAPTRLQASTRYINYQNFEYVTPPSIENNQEAYDIYSEAMKNLRYAFCKMDMLGVPREDMANLLPLGMTTKIVLRTNLRNLIDMSHQRMCTRAYWEFRKLMSDIINALREYSDEWKILIDEYNVFQPKCEVCGFCTEKYSCGRRPKKDDPNQKTLSELVVNLKMSWKDFLNEIKSDKVRKFLEDLVDKD